MGVVLSYSLPLLFLTLCATANLLIPAVNGEVDCMKSKVDCTKSKVPCPKSKKSTLLIVFGDSFFDVGYGSNELCLPSSFQPYGKSLDPAAPTGRFSDGLVVPDYIAKYLHLADDEGKVAAYKRCLDIQETLQGQCKGCASLSFAMAGAGVTLSAHKSKSLTDQVQIFINNSPKLFVDYGAKFVDERDQTLYLFSIGTYDYLSNLQNIKNEQDVQEKAEEVTAAIVKQVKEIAERQGVNGKRFAFMSVALRYLPVVQKAYYKDQSRLNLLDELENTHCSKLEEKLAKLAQERKATCQGCIIDYSILKYHRIIRAIMEAPESYGFDETTVMLSCYGDGFYHADDCGHSDERGCNCGHSDKRGCDFGHSNKRGCDCGHSDKRGCDFGHSNKRGCDCGHSDKRGCDCGHSDKRGCNDPSAYVFWDGMHNTQRINQKIAQFFWNGPKSMTAPQNLQTLAGTQKPQFDFSVNANELIRI
ncbi:hypothetical protein SLEP1_g39642 [Rubroshorea leprosula]|uniref:Uncharacterized protein n=1 Tax=Rubroshorea leprosula TaxID=152421 RepID=A0AAV5L1G6_9ROSI|nr:hypothetical protein SLEP1_g39642 [Rubroshorea leprosula]